MEQQTTAATPGITAGLYNMAQVAGELGCSERTLRRWEHAGMPVIRLGILRFYDPTAVRAWIMKFQNRHDAPKRGRPRKADRR